MGYPLRWEQLAAPGCADDLEAPIAIRKGRSAYYRKLVAFTLAGAALLVVIGIGISSFALMDRPLAPLSVESVASAKAVPVSTPRVLRRVGFVLVAGAVANRSTRSLAKVEAVVDLLDANQQPLRTQSAMIDRDAIAPGQVSSFQVQMPDVAAARSCRVHFKKLCGADID